jgi:N-acetylglucosaminyldiphosphoundecaprenol N-acetyl-beta-D-mannosaminyltransferase
LTDPKHRAGKLSRSARYDAPTALLGWLGDFVDSSDVRALRRRVSLFGILVDRVNRARAVSALEGFLADGGRHQVVTVNLDFMRLADRDPEYRRILNQADLAVADGMPIVWLSRLGRDGLPERVAGIDLVEECCRLAARTDVPLFLLGAALGVAEAAGRALVARHPGLRIAGVFAPAFAPPTPEGDAEMFRLVRDAGRCVLFVAFGAPRQDRFISTNLNGMDCAIAMGVGGTFDILSGTIPRAPLWMQRSGLEWVWRLVQEPGRLWRRYLVRDLPFAVRLGARALFGRAAVGSQ